MRKHINLLVAFLALFVLSSTANAQILIDDFDNSSSVLQIGLGESTQTIMDPNILGGQRIDTVEVVDVSPAIAQNAVLGFNVGGDSAFSVGQGAADQIVGSLFFDSIGGEDLTDGGTLNAFQLDFVSSDSATPTETLEISVVSTDGATAFQSVTVPSETGLDEPVLVDFSGFGGVDFTSVDSLTLSFDFATDPGGDFGIGSIEAVNAIPEPGSLMFLSMSSLILLRRRRV